MTLLVIAGVLVIAVVIASLMLLILLVLGNPVGKESEFRRKSTEVPHTEHKPSQQTPPLDR